MLQSLYLLWCTHLGNLSVASRLHDGFDLTVRTGIFERYGGIWNTGTFKTFSRHEAKVTEGIRRGGGERERERERWLTFSISIHHFLPFIIINGTLAHSGGDRTVVVLSNQTASLWESTFQSHIET